MVEVIKSSFIPKKEIKKSIKKNTRRGGGINIFFLIALVIFLSTIIGAFGMYLWRADLKKKIEDKKELIKRQKESFGIEIFKKFILLDKRINVAKELTAKHYAIKPVFKFLEKNTIPDIYYEEMTVLEEGDYVSFKFKGVASEFGDIVLQKDIYTQNPNIEDFVFLNITRSIEGKEATFDMSFRINKKYLTTETLFINN